MGPQGTRLAHWAGQARILVRAYSLIRAHPIAAATAGVALICALMMVTIDRPVSLAVHENLSADGRALFKAITDLGLALHFVLAGLVVYVAGRALFLLALPDRLALLYLRLSRMALYLLATMAVSGAVVHVLKFAIGRLRPKHLLRDDQYGFAPGFSDFANNAFPSGHSQTIFSVMTVLTLLFPRFWFVFLPFAAVVAFSRIMVSAHFPSDVVMGSYIGLMSAVVVKRVWFSHLDTPALPATRPALAGGDAS